MWNDANDKLLIKISQFTPAPTRSYVNIFTLHDLLYSSPFRPSDLLTFYCFVIYFSYYRNDSNMDRACD
jgi:hypothetical protein